MSRVLLFLVLVHEFLFPVPVPGVPPGPLGALSWSPETRRLELRGDDARRGQSFIVFVPSSSGHRPRVRRSGLRELRSLPAPGGHHFVVGRARGGSWSLQIDAR